MLGSLFAGRREGSNFAMTPTTASRCSAAAGYRGRYADFA